jgi:hypothetical protein
MLGRALHPQRSMCLKVLREYHKGSVMDVQYAVHTQVCNSVLVTTLLSWPGSGPLLSTVSYDNMLQTNVKILQYIQNT